MNVIIGAGAASATSPTAVSNGSNSVFGTLIAVGGGGGGSGSYLSGSGPGSTNTNGGTGGSGVVILRYMGSQAATGGTVTSVATAGTVNGLTLTGGPITSSGTVTLGGTLDLSSPPAIGGTTANLITGTTITATKYVGISGGTF